MVTNPPQDHLSGAAAAGIRRAVFVDGNHGGDERCDVVGSVTTMMGCAVVSDSVCRRDITGINGAESNERIGHGHTD